MSWVENYKSTVKHKLGIDYEAVKKVNPRVVYGSISGFGQDGPYAGRAGVDQIAQGMGGLMSITGHPGGGPVRVGIAINDTSAGLLLANAIVLALLDRERTGEGQWVTTSLIEAQIFMLDFQAARYLMRGEVAGQEGNNQSNRARHRHVPDGRRLHQPRRLRRQPVGAFFARPPASPTCWPTPTSPIRRCAGKTVPRLTRGWLKSCAPAPMSNGWR